MTTRKAALEIEPEPDEPELDIQPEPEPEPEPDVELPLYGEKPIFTYTPKDGGDNIIFPAHSTIRGEVAGKTYLEFLWEMDEYALSDADQVFSYLRRSGATQEMKRRVVRLPDGEITVFFREWVTADDEPPATLPPES